MDACAPLWSGADPASSVLRDYLIASLALSFESELIDALVTDITGALTTLDTALSTSTLNAGRRRCSPVSTTSSGLIDPSAHC